MRLSSPAKDPRDEMTARLLDEAGVGPGMSILDVGCARGAVTAMVAARVGFEGHVLGIDRDAESLAGAPQRMRDLGLRNVEFRRGDLTALPPDLGLFDAIVGRRVLMYLPDATRVVAALARFLKPGGLMAFEEVDATMVPGSVDPLPLHERMHALMWRTVAAEGGNLHMGFDLYRTLAEAGLEVQRVRAEAVVQTPATDHPTEAIVRAMLPRMRAHDVVAEGEIDPDGLAERLAQERRAQNATYVGDMAFFAWARKPIGSDPA